MGRILFLVGNENYRNCAWLSENSDGMEYLRQVICLPYHEAYRILPEDVQQLPLSDDWLPVLCAPIALLSIFISMHPDATLIQRSTFCGQFTKVHSHKLSQTTVVLFCLDIRNRLSSRSFAC